MIYVLTTKAMEAINQSQAISLSMVLTGRNRISIRNILWVRSGCALGSQIWSAHRSFLKCKEGIANADHPSIRLFHVGRNAVSKPQDNCQGRWVSCTPQSAKGFSAVAYHFGLAIHEAIGKPVGLIQSTWGGTPVEGWTSRDALSELDTAKAMLERWDAQAVNYAKDRREYSLKLNVWEAARQKALREGDRAKKARPRSFFPPQ